MSELERLDLAADALSDVLDVLTDRYVPDCEECGDAGVIIQKGDSWACDCVVDTNVYLLPEVRS